jgi:DNA-binding XRE family transcriptional regulator
MSYRLEDVAPVGEEKRMVVDAMSGRQREVVVLVYPHSAKGRRLRELRTRRSMTLRAAARRLGLLPHELAELEAGTARPVDPEDWDRLFRTLREDA